MKAFKALLYFMIVYSNTEKVPVFISFRSKSCICILQYHFRFLMIKKLGNHSCLQIGMFPALTVRKFWWSFLGESCHSLPPIILVK